MTITGGDAAVAAAENSPIPTNTIPGELHQIQAYVDATNTRIRYLEGLLEPTLAEQITEIKRGLKDAHRGLEKLQNSTSHQQTSGVLEDVTRKTWRAYRRLVSLEERMRDMCGPTTPSTRRNSGQRVLSLSGNVPSDSGPSSSQGPSNRIQAPVQLQPQRVNFPAQRRNHMAVAPRQVQIITNGSVPRHPRPVAQDVAAEITASPEPEEETDSATYETPDGGPHNAEESLPNNSNRLTNGTSERTARQSHSSRSREMGQELTESQNTSSLHVARRRRIRLSVDIHRTRTQVLDNVREEEEITAPVLMEPERRREGSAAGWSITLMIMSGARNDTMVLPELEYMKIHEVKALKKWLSENGHIVRSDGMGRLEKLLHLLLLLQMGCRLETLATLFSCTPRQVQDSCREVALGLLEMHSETSVDAEERGYLCLHLWHISDRYVTQHDAIRVKGYYPWTAEELNRMLVTLNLFIGRYRAQGGFRLSGPHLDWARYYQTETGSRQR
ncbi:hypothetical protein BS50DRAFT_235362 [Corynespora cassiicola Philippines]|uniref:Uncharacterized protein n=1 Tax=Corynespora cassiicola Philippines TaxID=1448308 RepID=A0A2T2P252_CORCC|nr:hypothetical protein BS50DRAFT_235362 [Corynespora cassiicola Philippines]